MGGVLNGMVRRAAVAEWPVWKAVGDACERFVKKICIRKKIHQLRLEETLPLGDRRFLAVIRWEQETLLVGVTPQNITLVAPQQKDAAKREEFVWEVTRGGKG